MARGFDHLFKLLIIGDSGELQFHLIEFPLQIINSLTSFIFFALVAAVIPCRPILIHVCFFIFY